MIFGFRPGATRTKIAFNTGAQLAAKVLSAGTTFLVSVVLARTYGAESFGDFVKVTAFVGLFFLATDFGLNAQWLKTRAPWTTLLVARGLLAVVFAAVAIAALALLPLGTTSGYTQSVRMGIYLFLPAILFQSLLTSGNAVFQKTLRYELSTVALAAGAVVVLSSLFLLPILGVTGSMVGVAAMLAGIATTGVLSSTMAARLSRLPAPVRPCLADAQALIATSVPLGLMLLFNVVYGHVDSIILATTRSTAEVAFYGFAYRVFEFALAIPTFFMNAVYPLLLGALGTNVPVVKDPARFSALARKAFLTLVASSVAALILLWTAAPLVAIVRPEFAASAPALRVLALGLPMFFVSSLVMWMLIALGKLKLLVVVYGAAMALNIILNLMFIPRYGFMAAAWITIIGEALILTAGGVILLRAMRQHATAKN
jgi:O-antigen/teichoic acid export membrane protein